MKNEKLIIGKKIVKIKNLHDYAIVILEDGTEMEVSCITPKSKRRICKFKGCFYYDKDAKVYCYNACSCDEIIIGK